MKKILSAMILGMLFLSVMGCVETPEEMVEEMVLDCRQMCKRRGLRLTHITLGSHSGCVCAVPDEENP